MVALAISKAINNLLTKVEKMAAARKLRFRGIKKSSYQEQFLNGSMIEDTTNNGEAAEIGPAAPVPLPQAISAIAAA
jgi:hypothetical protein